MSRLISKVVDRMQIFEGDGGVQWMSVEVDVPNTGMVSVKCRPGGKGGTDWHRQTDPTPIVVDAWSAVKVKWLLVRS